MWNLTDFIEIYENFHGWNLLILLKMWDKNATYKILCDNLKANCNKNQLKQRNDAYKSDSLEK